MKETPRTNLLRQIVLVTLISYAVVAGRVSGGTPVGALSLEPLSVAISAENPLPASVVVPSGTMALPVETNQPRPFTGSADPVRRSGSPDFNTIVQSMDSAEYFGVPEIEAVPETSTWLIGSLAALAALRTLQKRVAATRWLIPQKLRQNSALPKRQTHR